MRLQKINLRDWRRFGQLEIEFDEHVTVIVGRNESGKTSILDALNAVLSSPSGQPGLIAWPGDVLPGESTLVGEVRFSTGATAALRTLAASSHAAPLARPSTPGTLISSRGDWPPPGGQPITDEQWAGFSVLLRRVLPTAMYDGLTFVSGGEDPGRLTVPDHAGAGPDATIPFVPASASPMAERLIAAVLPAIVAPRPAPAPVAALPQPAPQTRRALGSVAIDVARMDRSGRVRATSLLRTLGWQPGSAIDLDFTSGAIVASARRGGRHKIGEKGDVRLPISSRAMAGIAAGQPVFVAALVDRGILVIHPAHAITHALRRTYTRLIGERNAD